MQIEAKHGLLGGITIPFTGPDLYVRPHYGCPVVHGDHFSVTTCSGLVVTGE